MTDLNLSATPAPAKLEWPCVACHTPIADHDGYLHVLFEDIDRARDTRRRDSLDDRAPTLAEILASPPPAKWRAMHVGCDPDLDAPGYWIPVQEARTHARLLWWTAHLMGKTWLRDTNWDDFIKKASGV